MYFFDNEPLLSWDGEPMFMVERIFANDTEKEDFTGSEMEKRKYLTCYMEKAGDKWILKRKGTLAELLIFLFSRAYQPKEVMDSMRTFDLLKSCEKTRYEGELKLTDETYDWVKGKFDEKQSFKNRETEKVEESMLLEGNLGASASVIRDAFKNPLKHE